MSYPSAVTTERLDLRPIDAMADLEASHASSRDPDGGGMTPPDTVDRGLRIDAGDGSPRLAYADRDRDEKLGAPLRA